MQFPKVCALLIFLLLTSCASTFQLNSEELKAQSVAIDDSSPSPLQSTQPSSSTRADSIVNFDKIDSTLIAPGTKFDIQFSTESSGSCSHTLQYPQVSGLANTALQTELNRGLRQNMIEQMGITGNLLEGDRCPREALRDSQNQPRLYTWTSECKTRFADSRLVSIECLTLTTPGAYPHPEVHTVTFDLATGKIYQFADLFKPDSNYAVRIAVLMRDAWWETEPGYVSFPFQQLETTADFDFYFLEECDEFFRHHWESVGDSPLNKSGLPPEVCMVIPNLGSGASRNYEMPVRMGGLEEILDTSGALSVLAEKIDDRWQPY